MFDLILMMESSFCLTRDRTKANDTQLLQPTSVPFYWAPVQCFELSSHFHPNYQAPVIDKVAILFFIINPSPENKPVLFFFNSWKIPVRFWCKLWNMHLVSTREQELKLIHYTNWLNVPNMHYFPPIPDSHDLVCHRVPQTKSWAHYKAP